MPLPRKATETEIKNFKFLPGISQPEFDIYGFQLSTITYGIHPFKNGLPVNSGQPENFVETRSQKVNTWLPNMIICFTIPPKLIELIKESFLLQEFRFLKRGENDFRPYPNLV
jgi:hypothetical protein